METLKKDTKINIAVFILLVVVSLFMIVKFVNELKFNSYVGRGNQPANVILVNGNGEVLAVPDIAVLSLNLYKEGKTAKEATDMLNESITSTLSYLKDQKIEDKDIKSEYGGLSPKYSYDKCYTYPCPTNSKVVGYTATQSISVKVREVDTANDIRLGVASLGVTDISGPTFSLDDEENYKNEARSLAIKDARAKAEVLARELGVRLGDIVNFSESANNNYPIYQTKSMMDSSVMSENSAPVLPKGENKITSDVSISYEIK